MHTTPDRCYDDPRIAHITFEFGPEPLPARGWLRQRGRAMLDGGITADVWRDGVETLDGDCIIQQFGAWRVSGQGDRVNG